MMLGMLLLGVGVATEAHGQANRRYRPPETYVQFGKPDQAEGKKLLEQFRAKMGITGYFDFQLHILPRRGAERVLKGNLWAAQRDGVQLWRLDIAGDAPERLLIQNGPDPRIWRSIAGRVEAVTNPAVPIAGTELTAFDLQMPFLFWTDFVYEGVARLGVRPADQFILYPPAALAAQMPELTGVRIYLDSQFNALAQSQLIGEGGKILKTWTIAEVKRLGDVYIPKAVEVRNDVTRDKARFAITGAANGRRAADDVFAPASLAQPIPVADGVQRFE